MDHSYFKDRLSAFSDGDLPPYELLAIEEHLQTCSECAAEVEEYRRLNELIASKSELDDSDYWEKSAQKIEAAIGGEAEKVVDIRPKKSSGLIWKIGAVAASLAILTFIGLHENEISEPVRRQAEVELEETGGLGDKETTDNKVDTVDRGIKEAEPEKIERKAEKPRIDAETGNTAADVADELLDPKMAEASKTKKRLAVGELESARKEVPPAASAPAPSMKSAEAPTTSAEQTETEGLAAEEVTLNSAAVEVSDKLDETTQKLMAPTMTLTPTKDGPLTAAVMGESDSVDDSGVGSPRLISLRQKQDSLHQAIESYLSASFARNNQLVQVTDSASSTYDLMVDSLITTVYDIGRLSSDTAETRKSIQFLSEFPFARSDRQQERIDMYVAMLRGKLQ